MALFLNHLPYHCVVLRGGGPPTEGGFEETDFVFDFKHGKGLNFTTNCTILLGDFTSYQFNGRFPQNLVALSLPLVEMMQIAHRIRCQLLDYGILKKNLPLLQMSKRLLVLDLRRNGAEGARALAF
jgi:hypothetical protein